jgi:hypothetical protein
MDKSESKLWEEMSGEYPPNFSGYYYTDHGKLYFDGKGFIVPGHKRITYTTVEWWLKPYNP